MSGPGANVDALHRCAKVLRGVAGELHGAALVASGAISGVVWGSSGATVSRLTGWDRVQAGEVELAALWCEVVAEQCEAYANVVETSRVILTEMDITLCTVGVVSAIYTIGTSTAAVMSAASAAEITVAAAVRAVVTKCVQTLAQRWTSATALSLVTAATRGTVTVGMPIVAGAGAHGGTRGFIDDQVAHVASGKVDPGGRALSYAGSEATTVAPWALTFGAGSGLFAFGLGGSVAAEAEMVTASTTPRLRVYATPLSGRAGSPINPWPPRDRGFYSGSYDPATINPFVSQEYLEDGIQRLTNLDLDNAPGLHHVEDPAVGIHGGIVEVHTPHTSGTASVIAAGDDTQGELLLTSEHLFGDDGRDPYDIWYPWKSRSGVTGWRSYTNDARAAGHQQQPVSASYRDHIPESWWVAEENRGLPPLSPFYAATAWETRFSATDLRLIRLPRRMAGERHVLTVPPANALGVAGSKGFPHGEPATIVGYPDVFAPSSAPRGMYSSEGYLLGANVFRKKFGDLGVLHVTNPSTSAMSGAPVIVPGRDGSGHVVAVVSGGDLGAANPMGTQGRLWQRQPLEEMLYRDDTDWGALAQHYDRSYTVRDGNDGRIYVLRGYEAPMEVSHRGRMPGLLPTSATYLSDHALAFIHHFGAQRLFDY
jgi:hypothetical protein